jgi:hypothetical protein
MDEVGTFRRSSMKRIGLVLGFGAALFLAPQAASAQYTFAGQWFVGQGPWLFFGPAAVGVFGR